MSPRFCLHHSQRAFTCETSPAVISLATRTLRTATTIVIQTSATSDFAVLNQVIQSRISSLWYWGPLGCPLTDGYFTRQFTNRLAAGVSKISGKLWPLQSGQFLRRGIKNRNSANRPTSGHEGHKVHCCKKRHRLTKYSPRDFNIKGVKLYFFPPISSPERSHLSSFPPFRIASDFFYTLIWRRIWKPDNRQRGYQRNIHTARVRKQDTPGASSQQRPWHRGTSRPSTTASALSIPEQTLPTRGAIPTSGANRQTDRKHV